MLPAISGAHPWRDWCSYLVHRTRGGKTEILGPIGLANESQNFGLDAQHLYLVQVP